MKKSDSIVEISKALIRFHSEVSPVTKDANNPFYKSQYATLDNTLETVKKPLGNAGLSFAQFPDENGLTTILMHESGEWIESTYSVPLAKQDPQGAGSAITYMRRYALGAILGLATEIDDDGNTASTPAQAVKSSPRGVQKPTGVDKNAQEFDDSLETLAY
jgi:ERF superfamily